MTLHDWLHKPANEPADYWPNLTTMGYGEPTFAAFYPNCHSVFGFHDPDIHELSNTLTYDVVGWYSNGPDDPLHAWVSHQEGSPTATELQVAMQTHFKWTTTVPSGQDFPQLFACYAQLKFDPPKGATASQNAVLDKPITVSVGNTGTEALSAYLAQTIDPDQRPVIEEQQFPETRKSQHSSGIPACLFVNLHAKMWLS